MKTFTLTRLTGLNREENMKKSFAAGASLIALVASVQLAGARDLPFKPEEVTGTIVYYTHWTNYIDSGDFDRWEAEFKAMYPGVEDVDIQGIATYDETMATRMATGDYGDVLEVAGRLSLEELGDFLLPLDDLGLAEEFYFADRWAYDGHVYAFTDGVNAEGIVYNKDVFAKAGITKVPTTWTELKDAMAKIKAAGAIPMVLNMGSGWPLSSYDGLAAAMSGTPDFNAQMLEDPAPFAADKPYGKSFAILKEIIDSGWTEEDLSGDHWQDSKGWMASGQAGMWFLGNWSINQIVSEGAVLANVAGFDGTHLGYFPFPYDDSGKFNANSGPDWAMAINKDTANPILAKAWVDFLLTKSDLSQIAGFIPGCKCLEPTLPQLSELNSYGPTLIGQNTAPAAFTDAQNLIGMQNGALTRELMLASDYAAAIDALNARWAEAVERSK